MSSTDNLKSNENDHSRKLQDELQKTKEALIDARGEVEKLKAELMRMELDGKKLGQDYEMKKLEFQKEMMELQTKQALEKQQLMQQK